jgi:HK97 family phage major capsid protein
MNKRLKALYDERAALKAEHAEILGLIQEENRDPTDAEAARCDAIFASAEAVNKSINWHEKQADAERKIGPVRDINEDTPEERAAKQRQEAADAQTWGLGEFLVAVAAADCPGGYRDPRLVHVAATASGSNERVPSEGGYLVGTDMLTEFYDKAYNQANLLSRCRITEIGQNSNSLKINLLKESSRATGSRYGGLQVYWSDEAAAVAASKPTWREWESKLQKLTGLMYATEEVLEDATALASLTSEFFPAEFAFRLDDGCFRGTGGGQMLGILNSPALVTVAANGGQTADTILAENVMAMFARMWPGSLMSAEWFINQQCWPQLFQMKIPSTDVPIFQPPGGLSQAPFGTLLGRPVVPIEQASAIGDVGDISFVDWKQYRVIRKGKIKNDVSVHVRFIYGESTFRWTIRVNGQPMWEAPLTPFKGADTLSPFVTLAAR